MERSTRAISALKLRELGRQRARLEAAYGEILDRSRAAGGEHERLALLVEGLGELRFASQPIHDRVLGIEGLLLESRLGLMAPARRVELIEEFERECELGLARARQAELFGAILDDSAQASEQPERPPAGREDFVEGWLAQASQEADGVDLRQLEELWVQLGEELGSLRESMQSRQAPWRRKVTREELKALLKVFAGDPFQSEELREEARELLSEELVLGDLCGALTVMLDQEVEGWDWPEGTELRVEWLRERWRSYVTPPLLDLLFLQLLGMRVAIDLKQGLQQRAQLSLRQRSASFDEEPYTCIDAMQRQRLEELFLPSVPTSYYGFLDLGRSENVHYAGWHFSDSEPDMLQRLLVVINAELGLMRASQEEVVAFHCDIREYFLSIPHEVLARLLEVFGLAEPWRALIMRYLRAPFGDEADGEAARGIPLNFTLSYLLAELLLRQLDLLVYRSTGYRLIRFLDDIYFVGPPEEAVQAWEIIESFCEALGMELNAGKSGAVAIGAELGDELPQQPFCWGSLRLDAQGHWRPGDARIEELAEGLRETIGRRDDLLQVVKDYNHHLNVLIREMAPFARLESAAGSHLEEVAARLARFHGELFGPGEGIVEHLRGWIARDYGASHPQAADLPIELVYWPITAGGLGLSHPVAALVSFTTAQAQLGTLQPPQAPVEEEELPLRRCPYSRWNNYYGGLLQVASPQPPQLDANVSALREGFMARAGELLGQPVHELSAYWSWVLRGYGPQLERRFGGTSYLMQELVPLQLVVGTRAMSELVMPDPPLGVTSSATYYGDDDIPF